MSVRGIVIKEKDDQLLLLKHLHNHHGKGKIRNKPIVLCSSLANKISKYL